MTNFTQEITFRYPKPEDLDQMTEYINRLSQENTYIRFSGEEITKEEEASFLEDVLKKIESHNDVMLLALAGENLIGIAGVHRNTVNKKRSYHAAELGISLAAEYRGRGIGERLAREVLAEAERSITGLRMIYLTVFAINKGAFELYKKLGFREVGRIPEFILHNGEYVDEIVMVRKCL
ncbi:MAG TPA: GNAT family protein [Patescibacteria group bacterium]